MIRTTLLAVSLAVAGSAYADDTSEFREYFETRFLGSHSSSDRTWDLTIVVQKSNLEAVAL